VNVKKVIGKMMIRNVSNVLYQGVLTVNMIQIYASNAMILCT